MIRYDDGRGVTVPHMRDLDERNAAIIVQRGPVLEGTNGRPSDLPVKSDLRQAEAVVRRFV